MGGHFTSFGNNSKFFVILIPIPIAFYLLSITKIENKKNARYRKNAQSMGGYNRCEKPFFLYEGRRMSRKIKLSVIYIRFESEQAENRREKHFS